MDIDALKTFLEVNRCRHFGQAAKNLYISQSTVSARIKLLEERMGVPLFTRQRNNIQLTPYGEKLLKYADSIITTWNRARQEIAIVDEDHIPFVVGAQPSLWDSILGNWMHYIYKERPEVLVNAEVHDPETLVRRIQENTMDIAFLFESPQAMDIECTHIIDIPLVMVSTHPHKDKESAIKDNYIYVEWGTGFSTAHARHYPNIGTPRVRIMLGRIALDYLLSNCGTAYLPEPMVTQHLKDKKLYLINSAPIIKRSVYAIYAHQNEQPDLINLSCQFFQNSSKS